MHKSYQPLKPVANKFLQRKWDQDQYAEHQKKVREAKSVVDTKGFRTPSHLLTKLKKVQVEEERQAIINRDNKRLASNIADIQNSKGRLDNHNIYPERSLNYGRRRARLLEVCHENQKIHERIIAQESEYRRELWEEDWAKSRQWRDGITRYPRGVTDKQKTKKSVKFLGEAAGNPSSNIAGNEAIDEDHSEDDTE